MFAIDKNMNLYLTRGDGVLIPVSCKKSNGDPYTFRQGETLTLRVFKKRRCAEVVLTKAVTVTADSETVDIFLSSADTRIGDAVNGPVEYWYEIELNSGTEASQTVIGYDRRGPKIFRIYPEGADGGESGEGAPTIRPTEPIIGYVLDPDTVHGRSAYEIALLHGFEGTEEEWLASLSENAAKGCVNYFSNALVGYEKEWDGSALLFDDVSPLDHKVKVTSNGYAISPIVSCGKNLLHTNSFTVPYADTTMLFEGKITGNFAFSFDDNLTGVNKSQAALFQFIVDGSSQYVTSYGWSQSMDKVFTFSGTLTKVYVHTWNEATGGSLDNIQLEVGTSKTDFEPYKQGEAIDVSPGNTVGFQSISPNMTLYMNGAIGDPHEISYNKDANKVIEKLTNAIINMGGNV